MDGRKCKVWEYGKAGSMGGGGLILRQIQSKSLVSCNNKWFSVQLALVAVADVQKKKCGGGDSQSVEPCGSSFG